MTLLPRNIWTALPHLLLGGGMGAGAAIAYVLADREPRALIDTFQHWGAPAFLGLVALVFVSQGASRVLDLGEKMLPVLQENASSQQRLADAVTEMARKDDEHAREMELVVDHLARNSRLILADIQLIKLKLSGNEAEKAHGHSAGG